MFRILLNESALAAGHMSVQFRDAADRPIDVRTASDDLVAGLRSCLCANSQYGQVLDALHAKPMDGPSMRVLERLLSVERMAQLRAAAAVRNVA